MNVAIFTNVGPADSFRLMWEKSAHRLEIVDKEVHRHAQQAASVELMGALGMWLSGAYDAEVACKQRVSRASGGLEERK